MAIIANDTTASSDNKKLGLLACVICALGALFYCYEYYLRVTPSVMTGQLAQFFRVDATTLGYLSASYYYAYTMMQIPMGVMMDKYGPRRILTVACALCALGTFLFAGTPNLYVAAVGRFIVGFGSAFAYVGVLKLATLWLPNSMFAMFAGLATALGMLGAISGEVTMAMLVETLGWQQTVFYSGIAGVILTPVLWLVIRDKKIRMSRTFYFKAQTREPLLQSLLSICKSAQMWYIGLYGCLMYTVITALAEMWGIPFLRDTYQYSREAAALANSLLFLGFAVGGPLIGWFSDRIKRRCLPMIIGAIGAALPLLLVVSHVPLSRTEIEMLLFVSGFFSSAQCLVFALACDNNLPHVSATACAFVNMVVMMGGAILQPLMGTILDMGSQGNIVNGIHVYTSEDYRHAIMIVPIMLVVSIFIALFLIRETRCQGRLK